MHLKCMIQNFVNIEENLHQFGSKMSSLKNTQVKQLIQELYKITQTLESLYEGRHFTPDGHLVGSIGECLVADAYGLELMPASNKGYDAVDNEGRKIEIKATQASRVAFRHEPDFVIVIKILADGTFQEVYNGQGSLVWDQFKNKKLPSNGQYQISLSKLEELNQIVSENNRILPA